MLAPGSDRNFLFGRGWMRMWARDIAIVTRLEKASVIISFKDDISNKEQQYRTAEEIIILNTAPRYTKSKKINHDTEFENYEAMDFTSPATPLAYIGF